MNKRIVAALDVLTALVVLTALAGVTLATWPQRRATTPHFGIEHHAKPR